MTDYAGWTVGTTNTSGLTWNGITTYVYPNLQYVPSPVVEEKKMDPKPVAGGAPTRTLFSRYITSVGGYRGQVVYGEQERSNSNDVMVLWESGTFKGDDARSKAMKAAEAKLERALQGLFA